MPDLSAINSTLLPANVTEPIFEKATEVSAVMQLARRVPLSITAQSAIPIPMDVPAAGWVAEGAAKPVGSGSIGVKMMSGKKVALIVPVSQEVASTNAAGLYSQLRQDLPTAISRAFDHAAIHGKDLRTGGAGPFADYVLATPNSVELGSAVKADGGVYTDLVNGEKVVVDNNYDFSGFAADPRLRPTLKLQVDTQGRPIWVDNPTLGTNGGQLIGYPAFYNRGVSGDYRRNSNSVQTVTLTGAPTAGNFTLTVNGLTTGNIAWNATGATVQTAVRALGGPAAGLTVTGSAGGPYTIRGATSPITADGSGLTGGDATVASAATLDTKLRAVGGDWSQAAWGQGMGITIKVSTEASYVDESGTMVSAFQNNLVLLLVEAYYGFVLGDTSAFVAYTDAA